MNDIAQALAPHDALTWAWRLVVWVSATYLLGLGALVFLRPAIIHRFFSGFVTSWRVNFLEAVIRLIIGLAFVAVSPETRLPLLFFLFGAAVALTAIPMMFLYRLHKAQAVWVIPFTKRFLPLMGVVAIAAGGLVVWATI